MKYQIKLNKEDYVQFNIFSFKQSKAGKFSMNLARMTCPILGLVLVVILILTGARSQLILAEAIFLAVLSVVWWFYMPRRMEKSIRKSLERLEEDGKLPFSAESELEFQDSMIVEKTEKGEIHVSYQDLERVYLEKDYFYLFYGAVEAFVIPCRCLGEDRQRVADYLMEKRS